MKKQQNNFSIYQRIKSFSYAFSGLWVLVRDEHNARIHLFAAICAIGAGIWLKISLTEWILIIVCITAVITAEAFNAAIEAICDLVTPEWHPLIKKAKDLGAAAVLLCAIGALTIGLLIFIPHI